MPPKLVGPAAAREAEDPQVSAMNAITLGLGSLLEVDDRVKVQTHAGSSFEGTVEDVNAAAVLIRTDEDRLFLVPLSSMDFAEIFEETEDDGEGEDAEAGAVEAPAAQTVQAVDQVA